MFFCVPATVLRISYVVAKLIPTHHEASATINLIFMEETEEGRGQGTCPRPYPGSLDSASVPLRYRMANIFLTCLIFFLLTIKLKNNYQPMPFFCYHFFFFGHALGSESRILTTGPPGNS